MPIARRTHLAAPAGKGAFECEDQQKNQPRIEYRTPTTTRRSAGALFVNPGQKTRWFSVDKAPHHALGDDALLLTSCLIQDTFQQMQEAQEALPYRALAKQKSLPLDLHAAPGNSAK